MDYLRLTQENIADAHICCAFSDKKCRDGYEAKKQWLSQAFDEGYVFQRLDARAKVFIEYGPAEHAWMPIEAPHYLALGCFWVSGRYKRSGHGKALLQQAISAAKQEGKHGLVAVVGRKKFHFMSDTRWLLKQGFRQCDETESGFVLLCLSWDVSAAEPRFSAAVHDTPVMPQGCVVYYSHRCPYAEYHVTTSLTESCEKHGIPLTIIPLDTEQAAQQAPTPGTIFSLYLDGQFVTTDISVCLGSRFDKMITRMRPI